jgi:hypothetical protein
LFYKIFIKKNIMNKLILEEIQRMNLLSKYDNSKTLSEQAIPGGISQQAYDKIIAISNQNKKGFSGSYLAPLQQQEINKEFGADTYTKFFNNGGEALLKSGAVGQQVVKGAESLKAWVNYPCVTSNKSAVQGKDVNGGIIYTINGVVYFGNGRKKLANGTMANYTCNDAEFKGGGTKQPAKPVATPPELKDIKAFQDWLDVNAKGWATGYKDGIINKGQNGGGYGKYGPRTQKAWATYKDQFLKGGNTATQTPPEIEGEDNTQTVDPNDGEFGGGTTTEQPAKVETPPTNDQAVTLQGNPQSVITPGKLEPASGAVYGQQYKSSDGKTYVWNGTEYQVKA